MKKYRYQITYRKEPCKQEGDVKNSPFYEDELQAFALFDKTHRTSSIWRTWIDEMKGERWELLKFKVVYSEQELTTMWKNQFIDKWNTYKDKMTAATAERMKKIAKHRNIIIN